MSAGGNGSDTAGRRFDGVLFDLLTGLLDSWSLWDAVAGSPTAGRAWRHEYLVLTYGAGSYQPYVGLVAEAARRKGLPPHIADDLVARWDELEPWPEVPGALRAIAGGFALGVVTNCSEDLGHRAAARIDTSFDVVVTAESAGSYKPRPEPYQHALAKLGLPAERVLFVAGSYYDLQGATGAGMSVWWHNRIGMSSPSASAPAAEHNTLHTLPQYLARREM
ncbi:MAG: HAD family hydrolase [Solirubrobacteraceae bacterium]